MATKLIAQLERKQRDTKPIGPGDGDDNSDGPKRQKVSKTRYPRTPQTDAEG